MREFLGGKVQLYGGDSREVLKTLADASVDSVVCDPPYGLDFMGRAWDSLDGAPFATEFWQHVLRVLKPGGHLVAFSGTRTYHRLAVAIEDAGFEIRDQLAWVYSQGFPKSLDVSKAIDKAAGAEREVIGVRTYADGTAGHWGVSDKFAQDAHTKSLTAGTPKLDTAPATDAARQWAGYGTSLKPSWEPIVLARKPLIGTVAANVLAHGTGAINVDGCRIATDGPTARPPLSTVKHEGYKRPWNEDEASRAACAARREEAHDKRDSLGRWPANLLHDGSKEVVERFPSDNGGGAHPAQRSGLGYMSSSTGTNSGVRVELDSGGSAARFFYAAKADDSEIEWPQSAESNRETAPTPIAERHSTVELTEAEATITQTADRFFYTSKASAEDRLGSKHPTVKPLDLMQWLVRLVTPKGGTCLDPFAGTGTTGEAAWREGMRAILIEREEEYQQDIARRMELAEKPTKRAAVAKTKNKLEQAHDMPLFASLGVAE